MDENLKKRLIEKARVVYGNENTGHDFSHIERVLGYCEIIQNHEHADWDLIFVSALFHDVHRIMSDRLGKFIFAEESIGEVENLLKEFNFDKEFLSKVLYIISKHDSKNMDIKTMSKELQIVQDADILDAIGVKGLERTLKYCKTNHIPVTNTTYALDTTEYIPDVNPISTVHYISRTMIPQVLCIHTHSAKLLAENQVKVLKDFVNKSLKEHNVYNYELKIK